MSKQERRDKFRIVELEDGEFYQEEKAISFEHKNGIEIIHNKDTKMALEMVLMVKANLEEGIEIFCFMNDSEIGTNKYLSEIEIDIKLMSDEVSKIKIALLNKDYLEDDSILPSLTISGNKLLTEVSERDFERNYNEKEIL